MQAKLLNGEIADWSYEPEKLRLADMTYFIPDFRVVTLEGLIEFHETKAISSKGKMLIEDDAAVKIKVAAEQHWMYTFRLCGRSKFGWKIVEVG